MIKQVIKFNYIAFLLLIASNAFAHHSEKGNYDKIVNGEKESLKREYCIGNAQITPVNEKDTKEKNTKSSDKKKEPTWKLSNYHEKESRKFESIYYVSRINLSLNVKPENTLKEVLDKLCIHYEGKAKPSSNSDESLKEIYLSIAEKNKLLKEGKPSFNLPIKETLYKNGIVINNPKLVYHAPDFLIKEFQKLDSENKKISLVAAKKKNDQEWIKENKQTIVDEVQDKKNKQDKIVKDIKEKLSTIQNQFTTLESNYSNTAKDIKKLFDLGVKNKNHEKVATIYGQLYELKEDNFTNKIKISNFNTELSQISKKINDLKNSDRYVIITKELSSAKSSSKPEELKKIQKKIIELTDNIDTTPIDKTLEKITKDIENYSKTISKIQELKTKVLEIDQSIESEFNYFNIFLYLLGVMIAVGIGAYIYFQQKKISSLSLATDHAGRKFNELEGEIRSTSEKLQRVSSGEQSTYRQTIDRQQFSEEKVKTAEEIFAEKFDELVSDYREVLENFSKVIEFKQKWNGLALSRKERQDGSKTILINSSRAFEKSEIWCLSYNDKYFAFPGSSVKNNMATYMNLDFEKDQRDFKGVYSISTGTIYFAEPCDLRKGGAGFIVEKMGKLVFPL